MALHLAPASGRVIWYSPSTVSRFAI